MRTTIALNHLAVSPVLYHLHKRGIVLNSTRCATALAERLVVPAPDGRNAIYSAFSIH